MVSRRMWTSQHPIIRLVYFQECASSASLCPSQLGKEPEKLSNCEVLEKSEAIRTAAAALEDDSMITKLAGVDFIAKEVKYQH